MIKCVTRFNPLNYRQKGKLMEQCDYWRMTSYGQFRRHLKSLLYRNFYKSQRIVICDYDFMHYRGTLAYLFICWPLMCGVLHFIYYEDPRGYTPRLIYPGASVTRHSVYTNCMLFATTL